MAGAFLASFVFDVNVIFIILAAALAGVGKTLWLRQKGRARHDLCAAVFQLSAGGAVQHRAAAMRAMPLIQAQVVAGPRHGCTMAEFTNLVTIAEMTPGPIAVNSATFVGIRIAGVPGRRGGHAWVHLPGAYSGVCAGVCVPALQKRPGAGRRAELPAPGGGGADCGGGPLPCWARRCPGGAAPAPGNVQWAAAALFCAALVLLRWRKWNPILVMCLCGAASLALGACGPCARVASANRETAAGAAGRRARPAAIALRPWRPVRARRWRRPRVASAHGRAAAQLLRRWAGHGPQRWRKAKLPGAAPSRPDEGRSLSLGKASAFTRLFSAPGAWPEAPPCGAPPRFPACLCSSQLVHLRGFVQKRISLRPHRHTARPHEAGFVWPCCPYQHACVAHLCPSSSCLPRPPPFPARAQRARCAAVLPGAQLVLPGLSVRPVSAKSISLFAISPAPLLRRMACRPCCFIMPRFARRRQGGRVTKMQAHVFCVLFARCAWRAVTVIRKV